MIAAFTKAFHQLLDPSIRRVFWLALILSIVIFAAVWAGVGWLLIDSHFFTNTWLETGIDVLGGLATIALTWLLFPAVISASIGIFLDDVAEAVEAKYYPGLPTPRHVSIEETAFGSLRFLGIMVGVNLVMLVFLAVPPLYPVAFYAGNGYLLGREYFEQVSSRRLPPSEGRALRSAQKVRIFSAGLIIAFLLTIPFVNLIAPILGTAAMVHVFEGMRSRTQSGGSAGRLGTFTLEGIRDRRKGS